MPDCEIRVPFCKPWIGEEEIEAVADVLRSGWLSTGPKCLEFERRFAEMVGAKAAVATSSCTAAIHLAIAAADIGAGDEVITSTFTYTATAEAIGYSGAIPVLADIDPTTLNIDPRDICRRITPKTRAIVPVHIAGHPCRMDAIYEIAREHRLLVISDAAHAITTEFGGKMIGAMDHFNCFSFYPTKNITTGEGGMVTTNDESIAEKMRVMRLHGIDRNTWSRWNKGKSWLYEVVSQGFKYNLSDVHAAIGICQLEKLADIQRRREKIASRYNDSLADVDAVVIPPTPDNGKHSWHLYIIQLDIDRLTIDRDEFIQVMRDNGIACSVHFTPLHYHRYYQERYGYRQGDFPRAEDAYRRVVSLPFYTGMTDDDVDLVVETVKSVVETHLK